MLVGLSRSTILRCVLAVALVVLASGCGGTDGEAESKAAIEENWELFFAGSTPNETRVSLLQDGERFATAIDSLGNSPLAKQATAEVTSVSIDSPTNATVTFTILLNGTTIAEDLKGDAVLVDDVWKVGSKSLCELAAPLGMAPEDCAAVG